MLHIIDEVLSQLPPEAKERMCATDFTDNESARAAANKGRGAPSMQAMAELIARWSVTTPLRTMRVTTKENKSADDLSRPDGETAATELAARLGVALYVHELPLDHVLWDMVDASMRAMAAAAESEDQLLFDGQQQPLTAIWP